MVPYQPVPLLLEAPANAALCLCGNVEQEASTGPEQRHALIGTDDNLPFERPACDPLTCYLTGDRLTAIGLTLGISTPPPGSFGERPRSMRQVGRADQAVNLLLDGTSGGEAHLAVGTTLCVHLFSADLKGVH